MNYPWVDYRRLIDIEGLSLQDFNVIKTKADMLKHPLIINLVNELQAWPGVVLSSHKSASQSFHKLAFLADLGLTKEDEFILPILNKIREHPSDEGPFQLPMNITVHFNGSGEDTWAWALCDAPILLYALAKMGLANETDVRKAVDYLVGLVTDQGWPCAVSKELGKFRGPGKASDPCPYTNLIMLKLMALYDEYKDTQAAHIGTDCLLSLFENSLIRHPYMFYMGTDFRKLKVPFIWYDILHVAEVLSQFKWVINDPRFIQMMDIINSKADINQVFTPESIWTAFKDWDFGQKHNPSPWLSFLIQRLNQRINQASL